MYFLHRYKKDNRYEYDICECEILPKTKYQLHDKIRIRYWNKYYKRYINTHENSNKIVNTLEEAEKLKNLLNYQLECKRECRRKIRNYENNTL